MILAIDPGSAQTALVEWDGAQIIERRILPNLQALELIGATKADAVIVEMVASYGMPVGKEVFETVLWIGRFIERANATGKPVRTVYRKDIKLHLCHSMRAKDGNVRQALIDRLGAPGTKKAQGITYGISKDLWAALAVAVYAHDNPEAGDTRADIHAKGGVGIGSSEGVGMRVAKQAPLLSSHKKNFQHDPPQQTNKI